jgi:eukaryotic-like serine/threonine-protein kinase
MATGGTAGSRDMSPQRWARLESLYDAAVTLSPTERARFLEEQCGDDEELRRELTVMFGDGDSITKMVAQAAATVEESSEGRIGQRLGPYRIHRLIGQGGMGAVYEGVREDDFRKRVAIKLVKYSFDSDFARRRFQQERQILARLDHPNIARLLDGGDYEGRVPFLVMEFIEGEPLLARASTLGIPAKLRIFQKVLSAVAFAHRELIVHRDLKPANILVTGTGEPKLLDFGIARLLDEEGRTAQTMTAGAMMTPDYASPEQAKGEPAGVLSDIYSLGATLYELLSGARPHQLESYSTAEVYRAICEVEPRPPSDLAADRRVQRDLRGDLDTLVLHAMAKDPAKRYSSAEAFSTEIERYLQGLPLTVRRASSFERARKFVRRNRLAVAASAALAASLVGGITVSTFEARRAERRFAQVRELANTFLFQFYDQVTPLPGSTAVRASIVETARKYLDGLANEAGNDKGLIVELAQAYERLGAVQGRTGMANLGQVEQARVSFRHAIGLYDRLPVDRNSPQELRRKLGNTLWALGRLEFTNEHEDAAEAPTRRMIDLLTGRAPEPATRILWASGARSLGQIRLKQGRAVEAAALLESAMQALTDLRSSGYSDSKLAEEIGFMQEVLPRARIAAGDLDGALKLYQELLRSTAPCDEQAPPGVSCRKLANRLTWMGALYALLDQPNLSDPVRGAAYYRQAVHIGERFVALDTNDRQARFDLAARYGKLGDAIWESDPKLALNLYERALATARGLVSKEQFIQLQVPYLTAISRPLILLGRTSEARKALEEASRLDDGGPKSYPDQVSDFSGRLIWPVLEQAEGRGDEARRRLNEIIRDCEALRTSHPQDLAPAWFLSAAWRKLGSMRKTAERREAFLRSAAVWHAWQPATSFTQREEQKDLAAAR